MINNASASTPPSKLIQPLGDLGAATQAWLAAFTAWRLRATPPDGRVDGLTAQLKAWLLRSGFGGYIQSVIDIGPKVVGRFKAHTEAHQPDRQSLLTHILGPSLRQALNTTE